MDNFDMPEGKFVKYAYETLFTPPTPGRIEPPHVEDFAGLGEPVEPPAKIDYKAKDIHLYNTWAQTKSKKDLTKLVDHLGPIIYREVSRAAGALPMSTLNAEAKNWTIKAIHTYDPSLGFALSTHVSSYIRKVRRMNEKYQLVARLPANMKDEYKYFNNAATNLTEELNREPTDDELAARLGWTKGKTFKFKNSIYSKLVERDDDKAPEIESYSNESLLMHELMSRLTDEERTILKFKGHIPASELAAKLGVNNNRLNYLQNKLVQKIASIKQELKM